MSKGILVFIFASFSFLCLVDNAQSTTDCGQYIFILRGDTCEQLRTAFHMTTSDFEELNPDLDCQRVRPRITKMCVVSRSRLTNWKSDSDRGCPGPKVKAIRGDTCSKIGARLDVDEEHFTSNNPEIDCDNLAPGDIVCAAPQQSNAEIDEESQGTFENARTITPLLSESQGAFERDGTFGSALSELSALLAPQTTTTASVFLPTSIDNGDQQQPKPDSRYNTSRCPGKFVTAKGNETCDHFRQQHNIDSLFEFANLNPSIDCSRGFVDRGRTVCIRRPRIRFVDLSYKRPRGIVNVQLLAVNCQKWYGVKADDTCWTMRNAVQLNEKAFFDLNPGLDCASLKVGQQICLKNSTTFGKPCRLTFSVQSGQTCSSIAALAKMTLAQLKSINPTVDCDRLEPKRQICLSVDDTFDSEFYEQGHGHGHTAVDKTNADTFLRSASTRLSQRNLIDANTAQNIQRLLSSGGEIGADSAELIDVLSKTQSIALIKAVTQSNADFRRLSLEFDQRRSLICVQLTEGQTAYRKCVCDIEMPFIHCQALLMKDLRSNIQNQTARPPRHKRRHAKKLRTKRNRGGDRRNPPSSDFDFRLANATPPPNGIADAAATVGGAFAQFWRFFQKLCPNCLEEGCLAAGACFIIPEAPVFEVCVHGGVCLPNPAMLITTGNRLTVNQFIVSQINMGVGVCITGVSAVFKLVGLAACVTSFDLRYYYLRQQLELHPQIALALTYEHSEHAQTKRKRLVSEHEFDIGIQK